VVPTRRQHLVGAAGAILRSDRDGRGTARCHSGRRLRRTICGPSGKPQRVFREWVVPLLMAGGRHLLAIHAVQALCARAPHLGLFALDVNAEPLAHWRHFGALGATASGINVSTGGRELLVLDGPPIIAAARHRFDRSCQFPRRATTVPQPLEHAVSHGSTLVLIALIQLWQPKITGHLKFCECLHRI
jgi:hypothetical protein